MASDDVPEQFPDVSQKLNAAKKLSAFEKEKLAQEEKRKREKAETDAALKQFEDDFGGGGGADDQFDGFPIADTPRGPGFGPGGVSLGYGGGGGPPLGPRKAGPGSLGPISGPPPPNLKRKRALEELREQQEARREQEALANEHAGTGFTRREDQSLISADEPEDVAPKPTIQLSSLPPGTDEGDVRTLLRGHLDVHSVHFQPPTGQAPTSRTSLTAIATLSSETSTSRIDSVVSTLKDKYLGFGFHLSLSRHLSSTALLPTLSIGPNATSAEPFGAQKPAKDAMSRSNMRHAPPPSHFAPPESFEATNWGGMQSSTNASVIVEPPQDIKTVRAIHILVDRLLTEPDSERALEIEALLMQQTKIQHDERFSFLYDSKSTAGVYYRYLLWGDGDSTENAEEPQSSATRADFIHDDVAIEWTPPKQELPFADLSKLGDAIDHPDYESSNEDSEEGENRAFNHSRREGDGPTHPMGKKRLTPLQLAKLAWMLSRMPTSQAKMRMSEVAAVSNFAINNAGAGAEEIVDMLVLNVERPFTNTQCGKDEDEDISQDEGDEYEPDEELPTIESTPVPDDGGEKREVEDTSQAKLVALYLITDILQNSSTAGVSNAWKYRQLFENAFRRQKTFEHLGRLGKELGWGRMKSEQWRGRIGALFDIWLNKSVFANEVFEELKNDFNKQQKADAAAEETAKKDKGVIDMGRFKRIDGSPTKSASPVIAPTPKLQDVGGEPMEGLASQEIAKEGHNPMKDSDSMDIDSVQSELPKSTSTPVQPEEAPAKPSFSLKSSTAVKSQAPIEPRRRKQAEDMFADSDED